MPRLSVNATGSPLFGNFLMLVSVSTTDGGPMTKLKPEHFKVYHLASLNHASVSERTVTEASEGPDGFYTLSLAPSEVQPTLPPGHYVFAVVVKKPGVGRSGSHRGQTIAVGDLPA